MSQACCCVSCWVMVGGGVGEVSHSHVVWVLMVCPPHVPTLLLCVMLGDGGWGSGRSQPLTWCMSSHGMSSLCPKLAAVCHAGWWWVGEWEKSATHMLYEFSWYVLLMSQPCCCVSCWVMVGGGVGEVSHSHDVWVLMVCPPHVPSLLLCVMLGDGGWGSGRSQPLTCCMSSHGMSSSCSNLAAVCHAGWWWVGEWEKSATHMLYEFSWYVLLMSQPCCCVSCWVMVGGGVGEVSHSHDVWVLMVCPPHVPSLLLCVMLGGGGWGSERSQPLTWCMSSHGMSSSCSNLAAVCHAGWWWVGEWEKSATHMMFTMLTGCNIHDIYMLYGHYGISRDELHWSSLD